MKSIFLLIALAFASLIQAATTKIPASMIASDAKCTSAIACENNFTAFVSNTAVASQENLDFIASCSGSGGGTKICTFTGSIFTVAPNCIAITRGNNGSVHTIMGTSTSTQFSFSTTSTANAATDGDAYVYCQKQGVDYVQRIFK